jgi:hypothetical protein
VLTKVSNLMQVVRTFLQIDSIRLAIRGTGHALFAGSANINGGITLKLRKLKGIQINEDQATVRIGCVKYGVWCMMSVKSKA